MGLLATKLLRSTAHLYSSIACRHTDLTHNNQRMRYNPKEVLLSNRDAIMDGTAADLGGESGGLSSSSTIFQLWACGHIISPL